MVGVSLLRKLKTAITKRAEHRDALEQLEKGLLSSKPHALMEWRTQVEDWEKDRTKVNPYEREGNGQLSFSHFPSFIYATA